MKIAELVFMTIMLLVVLGVLGSWAYLGRLDGEIEANSIEYIRDLEDAIDELNGRIKRLEAIATEREAEISFYQSLNRNGMWK